MNCPLCERAFESGKRAKHECRSCDLVWMPRDEVQKWLDGIERRFTTAELERTRAESAARRAKPADTLSRNERYYSCPECGNLMNRRSFGKASGIIVSECVMHGTLLDDPTFRSIKGYVARGGDIVSLELTNAELASRLSDSEREHEPARRSKEISSGRLTN